MPCSETSRPDVSTCSSTRIPHSRFIVQRVPKDAENVNAPTAARPRSCTQTWCSEPVKTKPPRPVPRLAASAGTAKRPVAIVPHTPEAPWTATAPIGSSIPSRSTTSTPVTATNPAARPITIAAQGATKPQAAVIATSAARAPFSIIETSGLRSTAQAVATPPSAPAVAAELADPRAEEERAGERGERALVVDDSRAGEVLHAKREQPAARVPDPVRGDRVEDGEDGAEGEVDPQLGPLGHGSPDDREGHAGEDDLEEVAGRAGDGGEEAERRLADLEEGAGGGQEAVRPDEHVPVAEGEAEADGPVDERADAEDEHVLARDVRRVLHPREPGLE